MPQQTDAMRNDTLSTFFTLVSLPYTLFTVTALCQGSLTHYPAAIIVGNLICIAMIFVFGRKD